MTFSKKLKRKILVFTFLALGGVSSFPAHANLSITPTIVVMEGRDRYADIHLVNPTDVTNSYEIKWRFFKMENETGNYVEVGSSLTEWDLTKHLVYTPKRVTIDPKVAQKVRLGLRLGGEPPPPGDYRAHLEFMKVPDPEPLATPSERGQKGQAKVGVRVNVGFSIPVIYRVGESDAKAEIGNIKTEVSPNDGSIKLIVPVTKQSEKYGIAGEIAVYKGNEIIGQIKNANIFAEVKSRTFKVPLTVKQLEGGSLKMVYKDSSKKRDIVYGEKTIAITP